MVLSTSPSSRRVLRLAHGAHHLHVHGGCRRNNDTLIILSTVKFSFNELLSISRIFKTKILKIIYISVINI
jgi:hypothetical protein